jgi:hypothetical protein
MLIEDEHGVDGLRVLRVGDEYRDGWKLTALTAREATLARKKDTQVVDITRGHRG